MNIQSFSPLADVGIFKALQSSNHTAFNAFNVIYGANGSGKSTLSLIFESLELRSLDPLAQFPKASFTVLCDGCSIDSRAVSACTLNVRTFNQNFVKRNINWDQQVKGILLVSEEKIQEKKELEEAKRKLRSLNEALEEHSAAAARATSELQQFLTNSAKRIKTSLQVIDTADTRYMNYDRARLRDFIERNSDRVRDAASVLDDASVIRLTATAKPGEKPNVPILGHYVDQQKYARAYTRISDLLRSSADNVVLERLREYPDVQKWVQEGLDLHAAHGLNECAYCSNTISDQRKVALSGHFSDAFSKLRDRIAVAIEWVSSQFTQQLTLAHSTDLYDEFRAPYEAAVQRLTAAEKSLGSYVVAWLQALEAKKEDPLNIAFSIQSVPADVIAEFDEAATATQSLLSQHNQKSSDFRAATRSSKESLELHYAAVETRDFAYFAKVSESSDLDLAISEDRKAIEVSSRELVRLETSLSSPGVGAETFNKALHKFLGRDELSLQFDSAKGGYFISRGGSPLHDRNLSEGERTAIAFVYFVTKLRENNNEVESTIIVIDDPVSSFDSSNLFYAYAFLKANCERAKQLFVLTHNFSFFKLVRDWMLAKNRTRGRGHEVCNFYAISTSTAVPRSSMVVDADATLTQYQSEYHFVYKRLRQMSSKSSALTIDECLQCANLARKLLETFFSFKLPKKPRDLSSLLDAGLRGCTATRSEDKERIYRFINRYSHSETIETNDDVTQNLSGESPDVLRSIFTWIRESDPKHCAEMDDACDA